MRNALIVATATLLAGSIPALAIFGFGDIVFDPSSYGELVSQLAQMEKQYSELVSTYQMVTNQYNQMVRNAKMITSKARWKASSRKDRPRPAGRRPPSPRPTASR